MKLRTLVSLFAAALLFGRCTAQPGPAISGVVNLQSGWRPVLYLVQPRHFSEIAANYGGVVVDSARIGPDGTFAFSSKGSVSEKTLFLVCIQWEGERFANRLLDEDPAAANYVPVVLNPGETVSLRADAGRLQATCAFGNPAADNRAISALTALRQRSFEAEKQWLSTGGHVDAEQLPAYEDALRRYRQPLMDFADTTGALLPALLAVRWLSPEGDYERIPEFLYGQCGKWRQRYPGHPRVAELCAAGDSEKLPLMTGGLMPDFPLPMSTGDTISLHKLLGTRLTIVDLWASWCAPCRRENREVLAPIRERYGAKGLQIIGYSLDSSPQAWKAAIAKDGADWPHASHLGGDVSPFLDALRITNIPANFILDAEGKVLAKNLHGQALEAFVAKHLERG
jgi:peroxiredoxin